MSSPITRVVIVGGGYAGMTLARNLSKSPKRDFLDVTLVNPTAAMESKAEFDYVVPFASEVDYARIWIPGILERNGTKFVMGSMTGLNQEEKSIIVALSATEKDIQIPYDYLVLAMGADASCPPVPGLEENSYAAWYANDIVCMREETETRIQAAFFETDEQKRRDLLTFTVIGAGDSGAEIVGPLAQSVYKRAKRIGLNPEEITVRVVDGFDMPVTSYPAKIQQKVFNRMINLGIEPVFGSFVSEVTESHFTLANGQSYFKGMCCFAGGAKVAEWVSSLNLPMLCGRIQVNQELAVPGTDNIFAIGDASAFVAPGEERPVPMLAQHSLHQADCLAQNIEADLNGQERRDYKVHLHGQFVSVGYGWAAGVVNYFGGMQFSGVIGQFVKKCSYALAWLAVGGMGLLGKRWLESASMKRFVKRAHKEQ